ncbi:hypothetical protein [Amantichitinum ursilacus]|uniref:Uncharacterized protein n=1 Tax=Amantichitinum ursilacus TaxID=857265 RepID=A0A0N0XJY8_9NEIS|nr:hypothetical protein [Amantichitinum ursilacus]KPC51624.1 hypothetical protein WG78_15445 [Amantichitinum ursilacus]
MYFSQMPYRALFDVLLDYQGSTTWQDILAPWLADNEAEIAWLREFGQRAGAPIPVATREELSRLYALGRVNETLLLGFQPSIHAAEPAGPMLSLDEYERFAAALGMDCLRPATWSPFYHEVTTLLESPNARQPIELIRYDWPCLMLGNLLFSRAGVRVSAGARTLASDLIASSTLYWAYHRRNRPANDLSHGWGSNSQWATDIRRDYHLGDTFWFNVDGETDLTNMAADHDSESGLSKAERIELLTHRCLFSAPTKAAEEQWPYDDTLRVTSAESVSWFAKLQSMISRQK